MNVEQITANYLKQKALLDNLSQQVSVLKGLLSKAVDAEGTADEKGHLWYTAGDYLLQRQKRQGDKYIDREKAEDWAKERGIWGEVKVVKEELDEDALLGWAYEHRNDEALTAEFEALYVTPEPTWAFIAPIEQKNYDY